MTRGICNIVLFGSSNIVLNYPIKLLYVDLFPALTFSTPTVAELSTPACRGNHPALPVSRWWHFEVHYMIYMQSVEMHRDHKRASAKTVWSSVVRSRGQWRILWLTYIYNLNSNIGDLHTIVNDNQHLWWDWCISYKFFLMFSSLKNIDCLLLRECMRHSCMLIYCIFLS